MGPRRRSQRLLRGRRSQQRLIDPLPFLLLAMLGLPAQAAIVGEGGGVSATVQELLDGLPASVSTDGEVLDLTGSGFPISASAALSTSDVEDFLTAVGRGSVELADPAGSNEANPREFGLEVSCFSNLEGLSYSVASEAEEVRVLVFSSSVTRDPIPIEFDANGERRVESTVYFGGGMVFWSVDPTVPPAGMLGELNVTVVRDGDNQPLFESRIRVSDEDGTGGDTTSIGPILFDVGGIELLADLVDVELAEALAELDAAAEVLVVLVPFQSHTYEYVVSEDVELDISARFQARVRNVPGGSGAAAVWGRPFETLNDLLNQALPEIDGAAVQSAVNQALARRSQELVNQDDTSLGPARRMCGSLGLGGVATLSLGLCLAQQTSRRRHRR